MDMEERIEFYLGLLFDDDLDQIDVRREHITEEEVRALIPNYWKQRWWYQRANFVHLVQEHASMPELRAIFLDALRAPNVDRDGCDDEWYQNKGLALVLLYPDRMDRFEAYLADSEKVLAEANEALAAHGYLAESGFQVETLDPRPRN